MLPTRRRAWHRRHGTARHGTARHGYAVYAGTGRAADALHHRRWRHSQARGSRRCELLSQRAHRRGVLSHADVCGCGPHGLNMSMWGLTFRGATHIRIPSTTQDDGAISFVLVSHGNASFTPRLNDRRLPADSTQQPPSTWLRDVTLAPHYPSPGWQD